MLIKCPICELNFIDENEEMCNVCKNKNITKKKNYKFAPKIYKPKNEVEKEYLAFLEDNGYSMYTPSDLQSTAYSYLRAVNYVLYLENLTWELLAKKYNDIIIKYDIGGINEIIGNKSHKTVINALKRFAEFVEHSKLM